MLTKSKNRFKELFQEKEKALMPYVCFGYPTIEKSKEIMEALLKNGADALEIGFPFSDPVADGPLLTTANREALRQKIELKDIFETVKELRKQGFNQPITLMSYYNIILQAEKDLFVQDFNAAEIDALLIPDVPFEELDEISQLLKKVPKAFLIGLNTPMKTIEKMSKHGPEYFYLMAKFGVTGMDKKLNPIISERILEIKKHSKTPIAVGFGISSKEQAGKINAEGIIIGSLFTQAYNKGEIEELVKTIKKLRYFFSRNPKIGV